MDVRSVVVTEFTRRFGTQPTIVARGPGRVNLIGEHTDYNEGFVLPVAIDRAAWIAAQPVDEPFITVCSLDRKPVCRFAVDAPITHGQGWTDYVRGVAWSLQCDGVPLRGWQGIVSSDVPIGAGLSSSAALELAVARTTAFVSGVQWNPVSMARAAQRAENEWVGVNSGIMDQLTSSVGQQDHALLIDCRSLETRAVRLPTDASIVVLDTATRRGLVDSAYNERRLECERAAEILGVRALRDVDEATLARRADELAPTLLKRARHVTSENARTVFAAEALDEGDVATFGRLMNASHASLRDDFEVSRMELDVMASLAQSHSACYGARMTGAGFGGCVVALVSANGLDDFTRTVGDQYRLEVGLAATIHACSAASGASIERFDAAGSQPL